MHQTLATQLYYNVATDSVPALYIRLSFFPLKLRLATLLTKQKGPCRETERSAADRRREEAARYMYIGKSCSAWLRASVRPHVQMDMDKDMAMLKGTSLDFF